MSIKKQKFFTAATKKFYQNDAGAYFDYMLNSLNDVVEDVSVTTQPDEFEAIIISLPTESIRKISKGNDKNYRSYKIRFIDNTYGTDTTALPNPLDSKTLSEFNNRTLYHPTAVQMIEGEDLQYDFGSTVIVKKTEDIWTIKKVIIKSSKDYDTFINNLETEQEEKKTKNGYKPSTDEDFESKIGTDYDSITDKPFVNKKESHKEHFATLNNSFLPLVKKFIAECWNQKRYLILVNDGGRSYDDYKNLKEKYDDALRLKNKLKKEGKTEEANAVNIPARPSSTSYHFIGCALDFNPQDSKGNTILFKSSKSKDWIDSGIPDIAENLGLRWGGRFSSNYDPIHVDFQNYLNSSTSLPEDYDPNEITLVKYYLNKAKKDSTVNLYNLDLISKEETLKFFNSTKTGKELKNTTVNALGEFVSYQSDQEQTEASGENPYATSETSPKPEDYINDEQGRIEFLNAGGTDEAWEEYELLMNSNENSN